MLLGKDESGRLKPVPEDITTCQFGEKRVEVVFVAEAKQEAEVMQTCDQGFATDGTPSVAFYYKQDKLVQLYDADGNQIEEAPDRVFLKFNGKVSQVEIKGRGGVLEQIGDVNTYSWVADSAVLGLLSCGDGFGGFVDNDRGQGVGLVDRPSDRLGVAYVERGDVGTSFLAPMVAGVAAPVCARNAEAVALVRCHIFRDSGITNELKRRQIDRAPE